MVKDHAGTREHGTELFDVVEIVAGSCVGNKRWWEKGDIKLLTYSFAHLILLHISMACLIETVGCWEFKWRTEVRGLEGPLVHRFCCYLFNCRNKS